MYFFPAWDSVRKTMSETQCSGEELLGCDFQKGFSYFGYLQLWLSAPCNTLLAAVSPAELQWELQAHRTSENVEYSEQRIVWNGGISSQISKPP